MTGLINPTPVEVGSSGRSPTDPAPTSKTAPTKDNPRITRAHNRHEILRLIEVISSAFMEDIIVISL